MAPPPVLEESPRLGWCGEPRRRCSTATIAGTPPGPRFPSPVSGLLVLSLILEPPPTYVSRHPVSGCDLMSSEFCSFHNFSPCPVDLALNLGMTLSGRRDADWASAQGPVEALGGHHMQGKAADESLLPSLHLPLSKGGRRYRRRQQRHFAPG